MKFFNRFLPSKMKIFYTLLAKVCIFTSFSKSFSSFPMFFPTGFPVSPMFFPWVFQFPNFSPMFPPKFLVSFSQNSSILFSSYGFSCPLRRFPLYLPSLTTQITIASPLFATTKNASIIFIPWQKQSYIMHFFCKQRKGEKKTARNTSWYLKYT